MAIAGSEPGRGAARSLAGALAGRGHDVRVVRPPEARLLERRLARRGYEAGISRLPGLWLSLSRLAPDVVHCFDPVSALAAVHRHGAGRVPVLLTLTAIPDRRWLLERRLRLRGLLHAVEAGARVLVPTPKLAEALEWSLGLSPIVLDPGDGRGHESLYRELLGGPPAVPVRAVREAPEPDEPGTGAPEPSVSVVVPTRERPARLLRLLQALREQDLDPGRFEVLVVVDGGSPSTVGVLAEEAACAGPRLRVIERAVAGGPGAARNSGWRAARAPLVAFTDDDCRPAPGWLAAGLAAAAPDTIVQGPTRPDPSERSQDGLFARTVEVDTLGPQFETCNIFYPRRMLEALGGFDERYGLTPGGEDTDLAWRAIESGSATVFAPEALVFHAVERLGPRGMLRVAGRWSAAIRVFAEHPQTRVMLHRRVFWNVWHYLAWRSLLALAGPAWLRRMVLTLHARALVGRAHRGGSGAAAVAFLVLHDLVECGAVARGAVRYRTFVL